MKSFEFNGKSYESMSDFCKKNGFSYHKMRRLCRNYVRAHKNPAIAAAWMCGLEYLNKAVEPKTVSYLKDRELSAARQLMFKARKHVKNKKTLIKILGV